MIPRALHNRLVAMPPHWAKHYRAYLDWRWGEPDLRIVRRLCDRTKWSLDIGAHIGRYAYYMATTSKGVVAFEPNPVLADHIEAQRQRRVVLHRVALSDHTGTATLRIPRYRGVADPGRASIEPANCLDVVEQVVVPVQPLDEFDLPAIGLIKIDVEGHEAAVLRGGIETIRRHRPTMFIELVDAYCPGVTAECIDMLRSLGYRASFVQTGRIVPVSDGQAGNFVFRDHGPDA